MATAFPYVGFLGFDTYGTVVDWRSGISRAAEPFLKKHGVDVDPLDFADQWRALYQPAIKKVRNGERSWVKLDVLNRENLETVLSKNGADFGSIADALFQNDKHLNGSIEAEHHPEGKGRVEVSINLQP